ncbi:hypothetical protein [Herbaspirillum seropedicae]|uniref:hypothetical protein n=1 Tax=Herbaspirillum seropedicae TaxID=964 RepID=UPI000863BDB3|nr:hypothetical protein [Herbaspirillum seropedicae]AON56410.1 hypothetical protein Hsc_4151 [Herbaspirillum seropedicae]
MSAIGQKLPFNRADLLGGEQRGKMMTWVKDYEGMIDFLSLVIVHAPDNFPKEDYLDEDEQLTLETAFSELRQGLQLASARLADRSLLADLKLGLEDAYSSYKQGDDIKGAHQLQSLEQELLRLVS